MGKYITATVIGLMGLVTFSAQASYVATLEQPGGFTWVMVDAKAVDTLVNLARENEFNPAFVARFLACTVPNGTKAVLEKHSNETRTSPAYVVTIMDGKSAGCHGLVLDKFVHPTDGKLPF